VKNQGKFLEKRAYKRCITHFNWDKMIKKLNIGINRTFNMYYNNKRS